MVSFNSLEQALKNSRHFFVICLVIWGGAIQLRGHDERLQVIEAQLQSVLSASVGILQLIFNALDLPKFDAFQTQANRRWT